MVMMSNDRVFAVRDPRGFRPLAMGRIPALEGQKHDTIVFASETCAFDLIGAEYVRECEARRIDRGGSGRNQFAFLLYRGAAIDVHFRACVFLAA